MNLEPGQVGNFQRRLQQLADVVEMVEYTPGVGVTLATVRLVAVETETIV